MRPPLPLSIACCAPLLGLASAHDALATAIALSLIAVFQALRRAKVV